MKNAQAVMAAVLAGRNAPYCGPVAGSVDPVKYGDWAKKEVDAVRLAALCRRLSKLVANG